MEEVAYGPQVGHLGGDTSARSDVLFLGKDILRVDEYEQLLDKGLLG